MDKYFNMMAGNRWIIIGRLIGLVTAWAFFGIFFPHLVYDGALSGGIFAYGLLYSIGLFFGKTVYKVSHILIWDRIFLDPSNANASWSVSVPIFIVMGILFYFIWPSVLVFWASEIFLIVYNLAFLQKYTFE